MCGIFAAVHQNDITSTLVDGLDALAYRGYDSSGIVISGEHGLERRRAKGKIENLSALLEQSPLQGIVGIAHTRWATHGEANERNAHPHITPRVAVVHNGIIENYQSLRDELESHGYQFGSDTDSETIPLLITFYLDEGLDPEQALRKTLSRLEGSYAIAVVFQELPCCLYAARQGSPLVIGKAQNGYFISSDTIALANVAKGVCQLQDGDLAFINSESFVVLDAESNLVTRELKALDVSSFDREKQGYKHYMLKEIHQQPEVIRKTLHHYCDTANYTLKPDMFPPNMEQVERLSVVACGTSFYAGMVARHWIESMAAIPVDIDIASEYRYREAPISPSTLSLFISQSGETADTLAALRYTKQQGSPCLSLLNVPSSNMASESNSVLQTLAGQEIGVASTKAFTAQLMSLLLLTLSVSRASQRISLGQERDVVKNLLTLPCEMAKVLDQIADIERIAEDLQHAQNALFLGRGVGYPLALEGALKLKEISYIHAEAYPAGELKHGPIALVDNQMPVIIVAPPGPLLAKSLSNLREVASRGAKVTLISSAEGIAFAGEHITHSITMPDCDPLMCPLLYTLPLQLLAYQVATLKGTDVDQPRNLAKSVTVE